MTTPARYHSAISLSDPLDGSACEGCGSPVMLVHDHCHAHGWVRGIACMSCNQYLSIIDSGTRPAVTDARLAALLAVRNRCAGCTPLETGDLEPLPGSRTVTPSDKPEARRARARRLAVRKGYRLLEMRRAPAIGYRLWPAKGRPADFPSLDAAEEFLAG